MIDSSLLPEEKCIIFLWTGKAVSEILMEGMWVTTFLIMFVETIASDSHSKAWRSHLDNSFWLYSNTFGQRGHTHF